MGGGNIHGNPENIQEADADLKQRIRPIELIKHNPQLFHLDFYDLSNHWAIVGGAKTAALAAIGGAISVAYFMGGRATRPYNFYVNTHMGFGRFFFGAMLGTGVGYLKFGDRQLLHNAYVAERLRRRYPASMDLKATDLWQFKGVPASHHFYQWK